MRLALISDIHGNALALEAVLARLEQQGIERIVCLGDVAATGPEPRRVVDRLRELGCPVVMGNADAWLLDPQPNPAADGFTRRIETVDIWCAAQLAPADLAYLRTFRPTVEVPLDGGLRLLACHGSPRSNTDIIVATTPDAEVARLLDGADATVVAGGHTHTQLLRRLGGRILLNPGSIGLAHERDANGQPRPVPWAEYAVLICEGDQLAITLCREPLDVSAIARSAVEAGMPHTDWWTAMWQAAGGA